MTEEDIQNLAHVETKGRIPAKLKYKSRDNMEIKVRDPIFWFDSVEETKIEWFWQPYIPRGRLTMLSGDPGAGKSFITAALTAALTRGETLPGENECPRDPMNVLMLNVEDDPGDIIKPRLRNMGADMTKVASIDDTPLLEADKEGFVEGVDTIDKLIQATNAGFVIIDPIVAFLSPNVDMNRSNQMRPIFKALARVAQKRNVAILIVRHNRKEASAAKGSRAIFS